MSLRPLTHVVTHVRWNLGVCGAAQELLHAEKGGAASGALHRGCTAAAASSAVQRAVAHPETEHASRVGPHERGELLSSLEITPKQWNLQQRSSTSVLQRALCLFL